MAPGKFLASVSVEYFAHLLFVGRLAASCPWKGGGFFVCMRMYMCFEASESWS